MYVCAKRFCSIYHNHYSLAKHVGTASDEKLHSITPKCFKGINRHNSCINICIRTVQIFILCTHSLLQTHFSLSISFSNLNTNVLQAFKISQVYYACFVEVFNTSPDLNTQACSYLYFMQVLTFWCNSPVLWWIITQS